MYRCLVLEEPGRMRVEERPMPWLAEGEVLLEVLFSGVCQTDLSIYREDYRIPPPL